MYGRFGQKKLYVDYSIFRAETTVLRPLARKSCIAFFAANV